MTTRRWDTDDRGSGIASGEAMVLPVLNLLAHLEREGWVTEQPEAHLLPHLREACSAESSPWRLLDEGLTEDGVWEVELAHVDGPGPQTYRDAIALLSSVAEAAFFVRQVDEHTYECATGQLEGDGRYAPHGHLIRLNIRDH
ncbi:MAG: hypothetical protein GEV11_20950 [Streptosporangiales bacterium]|nr:hypothetical protein [Streptosporangiales bacterium]